LTEPRAHTRAPAREDAPTEASKESGDQPDSSITTMTDGKTMPTLDNAVVIEDQADFDAIPWKEIPVEIHYKVSSPFFYDEKASDGFSDVKIRGPVYVGSDDMLDRHDELVTTAAIMRAWGAYSNNPVILYNHSKTYGVIGRMVGLQMGKFNGVDVPIGTAVIDGGEKDITRKIKKGFLKAFSIGFIAKAGVKVCDENEESCYMKFTEIDWVETSIVDVPASPDALFSVAKSVQWAESLTDTSKSEDCGCGCNKDCSGTTENRVVRIQEDEDFISITYEKDDADVDTTGTPMEVEAYDSGDSDTKTVKNPVGEGFDSMTTEELDTITADTEAEETLSVEVAEVETPVEAVVETKDAHEEKEVEMPSPREALIEVAKALNSIMETLDSMNASEEPEDEVATLKAEIAEFRAAEEARTKEAEMEAEIERRLAERLAATDAPAPARKSITPVEEDTSDDANRFDPQPNMTKGMNGLASWLSANIEQRA